MLRAEYLVTYDFDHKVIAYIYDSQYNFIEGGIYPELNDVDHLPQFVQIADSPQSHQLLRNIPAADRASARTYRVTRPSIQ